MMWIWYIAAVAYAVVGVVSCFALKTGNALEVMIAVALWPFLFVARVLYVLVAGLTSRR